MNNTKSNVNDPKLREVNPVDSPESAGNIRMILHAALILFLLTATVSIVPLAILLDQPEPNRTPDFPSSAIGLFWSMVIGLAGACLFVSAVFEKCRVKPVVNRSRIRWQFIGALAFSVVTVALAVGFISYNLKMDRQLAALERAYAAYLPRLQAQVGSVKWSNLVPADSVYQVRDARKYKFVLVNGDTMKISHWQQRLIPPTFRPLDDHQSVLFVRIEERWVDAEAAKWQSQNRGVLTTIRPVRLRQWEAEVVEPETARILASARFTGLIEGVNFVNLASRHRTEREMSDWEEQNCLYPTEQLLEWLGVPTRK